MIAVTVKLSGKLFPFLHSTKIYPEWPFAAMTHVAADVNTAIQQALYQFKTHADVGREYAASGYSDNSVFAKSTAPCGTTKALGNLAFNASTSGSLAGWRNPRSYFGVRTMHEAAGILKQDDRGHWSCTRADTLYESIDCPEDHYKLDLESYNQACPSVGVNCEEGHDCFCKPCIRAFEVDVYEFHNETLAANQQGCPKMSLCGTVQQTKKIAFHARDNQERENADVTIKMHMAAETYNIPVAKVGPYEYEFQWADNQMGVAIMEVFVNDVQSK